MADTSVTLVGNCTRDVDLSFSNNGNAIAALGIAINNRKRDASGEWVDGDPQFFDIKVFGDMAENVASTIEKGTRIIVTGRLNYSTWENKDGDKRSKVEVIADSIGPELRWATAQVTKVGK